MAKKKKKKKNKMGMIGHEAFHFADATPHPWGYVNRTKENTVSDWSKVQEQLGFCQIDLD